MDLKDMSREDLILHIQEINDYMDNVIVFWGDKRELKAMLQRVGENPDQEFTEREALDAAAIVHQDGAFEELIEMLSESFERGGINYAISEKMSAIMQTVAEKHRKR